MFIANATGFDDQAVYTGTVMPLFNDMSNPSSLKIGKLGRAVSKSNVAVNARVTLKVDFDETIPTPPDSVAAPGDNDWGTGIWGQAVWGAERAQKINQSWDSLGGAGYALSLAYQVSSGSVAPLDDELILLEMTYTTAEIVT